MKYLISVIIEISMNDVKKVTCAIIRKETAVLLTRRGKGESLAGYWEFPGGKIEEDETPQRCLERELMEELQINSSAGRILIKNLYTYAHGTIELIAIETKINNYEFKLSVHDAVEWVDVNKLLNYQLAPADIPIAEKIMEDVQHV